MQNLQSKMNQQKSLNIVITGGNSGIGFETMKGLYLRGNNIIFGSRNQTKNQEALTAILNEEKQEKGQKKQDNFIKAISLDLSKRQSIEMFASEVKKIYKRIDILINNAGLIYDTLVRGQGNVEMTLSINHFGPFYLTHLLFDSLKDSPQARIINVSSQLHYYAPKKIIEDIECKEKSFGSMEQYQISKFMNVLFTQELSRKLKKYPNVKTVCLHPGVVASNFGSDLCLVKILSFLCCCLYVNNEQGARTSIHLSTEEFSKLKNGQYYHSNTQHKEMDKRARDLKMADQLWKMSEKLFGIKFDP